MDDGRYSVELRQEVDGRRMVYVDVSHRKLRIDDDIAASDHDESDYSCYTGDDREGILYF